MSNDLISRSALLKGLNEFCGKQRYLVPENVWNMIENAPTAYDVVKVVEQLEEQANQYHERANQYALKGMDRQVEHMAGKACSYEHSIEIVKAGGVNE